MNPTFQIHNLHYGGWSIHKGRYLVERIAWDEMLGEVARMLLTANPRWMNDEWLRQPSPLASVWFMEVTARTGESVSDVGHWFSVRVGSRFIDCLTPEEALGFIAAYTLTDGERQLFHGLETYEQWASRRWRPKPEIAGLLTCEAA